jgi:hypothetical protein
MRPHGLVVAAHLNQFRQTFGEGDVINEVVQPALVYPDLSVFLRGGGRAAPLLELELLIPDLDDDVAALHVENVIQVRIC